MCGIVALLSPLYPIDERMLDAMRDRLVHRGPDSASSWIDPGHRVGLAHRRLSIIDTSHAADQPMISQDGALHIVFNGEIYNYVELRAELVRLGVTFRTASDTEVLLNAFAVWGEGALKRLNGMFAFAIWDQRSRRLTIARDRFGEKPLFVGRGQHGTVAVASEMKAIFAHQAFFASVSHAALTRYGAGAWYEDDSSTFFDDIERLPPAHAAVFREDGTLERRWRYWTPDYSDIDYAIRPAEAIERFHELLERSVRLRLRADVPIGSSLSGGLDSSVIVGLLSRERENANFTQNTFSACFDDDPTISEGGQVDEVVRYTGVHSHRVAPTAERLADESMLLHWHQEEPFLSASIYLQWCVARLARQHNTTVLLDGQGADELLAGYQFWFKPRQLDMLDRGQMGRAIWETYRFTDRLRKASRQFVDSGRRFNAEVAYSIPELLRMRHDRPAVADSGYGDGVVAAAPGMRLRQILGSALLHNCLPMLLRYADRNAMAFSREGRFPFLDYDLVDFCIRLPDDVLVRDGWQKWPLRKAANGLIPEMIRWRADKVGYAAPLDIWLRNSLKEWALERLMSQRIAHVPGYNRENLRSLWASHQSGHANNSWALWRWISLAEWFEILDRGYWRAPPMRTPSLELTTYYVE